MKAIELKSKTNQKGELKITYKLQKAEANVRVLILVDDASDENDEETWMSSISKNPAFDFLKDSQEDIYSLNNGEPFND